MLPLAPRENQEYLYNKVKGSADTQSIPVLSPSVFRRSSTALASIGEMGSISDKSNLHYYTDGSRPTQGNTQEEAQVHLDDVIKHEMEAAGNAPLWVGEYGHRTDDVVLGPGPHRPNAEICAAYLIRGLFEFFIRGTEKVFIYNLFDDNTTNHGFGLLRNNANSVGDGVGTGLTQRPAYAAVQRTLNLFRDPTPFTPVALKYTLTGNLTDIGHHMFQKSDGTYLLAIWLDAQTWNRDTVSADTIPDRDVGLELEREVTTVRRHLPTTTTSVTTVGSNALTLDLSVPDELAVYELIFS